MDKKTQLLAKIAGILEVDPETAVRVETPLGNWDSLAVVSAMVAIEEVTGDLVSGEDLANCATVGDVLRVAGVA